MDMKQVTMELRSTIGEIDYRYEYHHSIFQNCTGIGRPGDLVVTLEYF